MHFFPGSLAELLGYVVEFKEVQDPVRKAWLIALGLFVDFRYFNQSSAGGGDDGVQNMDTE